MAIGMVTASASPAGTTGNPLISQRYLEGAFSNALSADIRNLLDGATGQALARLNELYLEAAGYTFAGRFTPVTIPSGSAITLGPGASFVLLSGSAALHVNNGEVINVSTGSAVTSGAAVTANQRFFSTENTIAVITASASVSGLVDGFYYPGGTIVTPPHRPEPPRPEPPPQTGLPFTDVSGSAWFFPAVEFVFHNGFFAGTTTTTFSPNTAMTRGMFVTVLHRLDGLPPAGGGAAFLDVRNQSTFYYQAVAWANTNGIVSGFDDGNFRPNQAVTREQMASIMYRYAYFKGHDMTAAPGALDVFSDRASVSVFAVDPMQWAVTWQVMRGSADGRLLPRNTASRAEVAQIVLNFTEQIG